MVRHQSEHLKVMLELGLIEEFQSFQRMPAFRKAKYMISFVAEPNNYAKFYGVYINTQIKENEDLPIYSDKLRPFCLPQNRETDFFIDLKKDERFLKFEGRLIIDWVVPRGWYNTYGEVKNKEVIKILPNNFVDEFPGLMNIRLSALELRKIILNIEAHSKWYEALTRLQAVYLIMDKSTGNQYVGTTYGQNGLWQRWESYVKTGFTGGNIELENLKKNNPDFYTELQFSILEVLSKNANQNECVKAESLWKDKLGTRAYGLNKN